MSKEPETLLKRGITALKSIDLGTLFILFIAVVFIFSLFTDFLGIIFDNRTIGSWYENPREYTTYYWVYLEPNTYSTQNYRVRANIEKTNIYEGEDSHSVYLLRNVFWNNGEVTYFDNCYLENPSGDHCFTKARKGYTVRLGEKITN